MHLSSTSTVFWLAICACARYARGQHEGDDDGCYFNATVAQSVGMVSPCLNSVCSEGVTAGCCSYVSTYCNVAPDPYCNSSSVQNFLNVSCQNPSSGGGDSGGDDGGGFPTQCYPLIGACMSDPFCNTTCWDRDTRTPSCTSNTSSIFRQLLDCYYEESTQGSIPGFRCAPRYQSCMNESACFQCIDNTFLRLIEFSDDQQEPNQTAIFECMANNALYNRVFYACVGTDDGPTCKEQRRDCFADDTCFGCQQALFAQYARGDQTSETPAECLNNTARSAAFRMFDACDREGSGRDGSGDDGECPFNITLAAVFETESPCQSVACANGPGPDGLPQDCCDLASRYCNITQDPGCFTEFIQGLLDQCHSEGGRGECPFNSTVAALHMTTSPCDDPVCQGTDSDEGLAAQCCTAVGSYCSLATTDDGCNTSLVLGLLANCTTGSSSGSGSGSGRDCAFNESLGASFGLLTPCREPACDDIDPAVHVPAVCCSTATTYCATTNDPACTSSARAVEILAFCQPLTTRPPSPAPTSVVGMSMSGSTSISMSASTGMSMSASSTGMSMSGSSSSGMGMSGKMGASKVSIIKGMGMGSRGVSDDARRPRLAYVFPMDFDTVNQTELGTVVVNEVLFMFQIASDTIEYVTFKPGSIVVVITFVNASVAPASVTTDSGTPLVIFFNGQNVTSTGVHTCTNCTSSSITSSATSNGTASESSSSLSTDVLIAIIIAVVTVVIVVIIVVVFRSKSSEKQKFIENGVEANPHVVENPLYE
eukprot:m.311548 g.311548  ORF g.311548 m.311548 type:complete len:766 (-) comp20226_c0_seq1:146-2443(-)